MKSSVIHVNFAEGRRHAARIAASLADGGLSVFPCRINKKPYTKNGFKDASFDREIIDEWFKRKFDALIGVPTGKETGIFVIDVDPNGAEWMKQNAELLKNAVIHITPRGHHFIFKMPDQDIRCSVGKIAHGVDVRANAGYIIWWPAHGYESKGDFFDLAEPSKALVEMALGLQPGPVPKSKATVEGARIYSGERNNTLASLAGSMRNLGSSASEIEYALTAFNAERCDPPLSVAEVRKIALSISRYDPSIKPIPLVRPMPDAKPYPVDALGKVLAPAAKAISERVQVPLATAGNCVLAIGALAAQSVADVETLNGRRPLSLFLLTIAASGDRKTSADDAALGAIKRHQVRLQAAYVAELERLEEEKTNDDDNEHKSKRLPSQPGPQKPFFINGDPTVEGLFVSFDEGQFSQGLLSDEGGLLIGSYALSEDAALRTSSWLSNAWQGAPLNRARGKDREVKTLYNRRLTLHLLVQPEVAYRLLGNPLFRNQGLLSRCLISYPKSIAGTRFYKGRLSELDPRIEKYELAVERLLKMPQARDLMLGGLSLKALSLSSEAHKAVVEKYNDVEAKLAEGRSLSPFKDFASKACEHAIRLAAVQTLLEDPTANEIPRSSMQNAIELVEYYLSEFMRTIGAATVPPEIEDAQIVLDWLSMKGLTSVTVREVVRKGPNRIRDSRRVLAALEMLAKNHWLRREGTQFHVNPLALAEMSKKKERVA